MRVKQLNLGMHSDKLTGKRTMFCDPWFLRELLLHDLLADLSELQRQRRSTDGVCMCALVKDTDIRDRGRVTRLDETPTLNSVSSVSLNSLKNSGSFLKRSISSGLNRTERN